MNRQIQLRNPLIVGFVVEKNHLVMSGSRAGRTDRNSVENQHIPNYIKNRPWYLTSNQRQVNETEQDYLAHHRNSDSDGLQRVQQITDSFVPIKYGSRSDSGCTNCGRNDHKKRDCLEPPRKKNRNQLGSSKAEISSLSSSLNTMVARDSNVLDSSYDAKRDRWYGYTPEVNANQPCKRSKMDESLPEMDSIQLEEIERLGLQPEDVGFKSVRKMEVIRQRDDVAPYLQDINEDEILYDPKSRVYKSKQHGIIDPETKMFHRHLTGDALNVKNLSEEVRKVAQLKGVDDIAEDEQKPSHVLAANPTKFELMMRESKSRSQGSEKDKTSSSAKSSTKNLQSLEKSLSTNKSSKIKNLYDMYM